MKSEKCGIRNLELEIVISESLRRWDTKIAHEWTGLRTNGENVGFFHSCAPERVAHEWAAVAHE